MNHPIKRGVSIYSYSGEYGRSMDLEDCFKDMYDMGATGIEILANSHIDSYPQLSDAYLEKWNTLCSRYQIEPAEYGHWIDTRLYKTRRISLEEARQKLINDFQIAHALGFHILRTKMGIKSPNEVEGDGMPEDGWQEIIESVLPEAEKYDVIMCPEIHLPMTLASPAVKEFIRFIETTGTEHFGLNIDLSVFQNRFDVPGVLVYTHNMDHSMPEDIIPILKYVKCIHAKFNRMDDTFHELTIPYEEIIKVLQDNNWNGYLISEYEGINKEVEGYTSQELKKQHIMLKRLLGY